MPRRTGHEGLHERIVADKRRRIHTNICRQETAAELRPDAGEPLTHDRSLAVATASDCVKGSQAG